MFAPQSPSSAHTQEWSDWGQPIDKNPAPAWMPRSVRTALGTRMIKSLVGKMSDYGLPEPEIGPFDAHATVSGEFLLRAGSGDVTMKGAIERLDGDGVVFKDGSREQIDVIVWATGYDIRFPFFDDPSLCADADNRPPPLFKRIMKPEVPDLFYAGLGQPLPLRGQRHLEVRYHPQPRDRHPQPQLGRCAL